MKTNGQCAYDKMMELKGELERIQEELYEVESDFFGAEVEHPNYPYCIIEYINGDEVQLYVEDENEEHCNLIITMDEFRGLLYK